MTELRAINPENTDAIRYDTFTHREVTILLVFSFATVVFLGLIFYPTTLEDAFITFRYGKHFAEGYGFGAWNRTGQHVEGYTSPLWMVLVGLFNRAGVDPQIVSKALGVFSHLMLTSILVLFPVFPKKPSQSPHDLLANSNVAVIAGVFLALYLPMSWYATSGMETVFFSALICLAVIALRLPHSTLTLSALGVLLILTRPEGALIGFAGFALAWQQGKRNRQNLHPVYISACVSFITLAALLLSRILLFGEVLPNTYWAKVSGAGFQHVRFGLKYFFDWMTNHGVLCLLTFLTILSLFTTQRNDKFREMQTQFGFILFLLLVYLAYILKVGGDNYSAFPYWRHFVHLAPLIGLLACYSITTMYPTRRYVQLSVLSVAIAATNAPILSVVHQNVTLKHAIYDRLQTGLKLSLKEHNAYFIWLKGITDSNTIIASSIGGELPYVVDAVHIDILGLNTRHIAKNGSFDPNGPVDSKTDMKWVLEQRPDMIEGYISATEIISGVPFEKHLHNSRYQMNVGLVTSPIFQQEYMFVLNAPYVELDRALFARRSWWLKHPMKDKIDCIPVAETTLALFGVRSQSKLGEGGN